MTTRVRSDTAARPGHRPFQTISPAPPDEVPTVRLSAIGSGRHRSPDRAPSPTPVPSPPEPAPVAGPPIPAVPQARSAGLFGARRRLRAAEDRTATLAEHVHRLEADVRHARREAELLHNKDAATLERETERAAEQLRRVRAQIVQSSGAVRAEQQRARTLADQNGRAEAAARVAAEAVLDAARTEAARRIRDTDSALTDRAGRLARLEAQIVETEDVAMLQEAGLYEFRHRLADAVAYKARLDTIRDRIKTLARGDEAVLSATGWTVNGSERDGRKMIREMSTLMLRAYNAEADNCVRTMRPHRLASSVERLTKARDTIARLGKTMDVRIGEPYHRARVEELELTADHLAKQEEEKERVRAERERQRDEDAARKEYEREKARLTKEQAHWERAQEKWQSQGDEAKVAEAQTQLDQLGAAIAGVEAREANIRTGWVYVISNVGAFGENMVKIGLTRRLDPKERVRELGDASVPFKFDVHALVFSQDAVSLENRLHQELGERRVNRVNLRREFFHATPGEVLAALQRTEARENLLEYTEFAEAEEWRTSRAIADRSEDARRSMSVPHADRS